MGSRVSMIVRSMARPELGRALASLAAQTHDDLEIVLVDATGGAHPSPPPTCGRFPIAFVAGSKPRTRPVAANAGLEAASGDYLGFLDDDDALDPTHVANLVDALALQPERAVAYTHAREVDARGATVRVRNEPYSRFLLFQDSYIPINAVLFRRALLEHCQFDATLEVAEDWDFWIQASVVSDFIAIPQVTAIYHSDLGTSGTGAGANHDRPKVARFWARIAAKWQVTGEALARDLERRFEHALQAYTHNDHALADALADDVLRLYRFHGGALTLSGTLAAMRGDFTVAAERFAVAAAENPRDASVQFNLAQALDRLHRGREAAATYARVLELEPDHPYARQRAVALARTHVHDLP